MSNRPQGPVADMFDDSSMLVDDELFAPSVSPTDARMQALETRLNEIYDFLTFASLKNLNAKQHADREQIKTLLPINRIHRGAH